MNDDNISQKQEVIALSLKDIQEFVNQLRFEYNQGGLAHELFKLFEIAVGKQSTSSIQIFEKQLRAVDALASLLDPYHRKILASLGTQTYNIARSLEPVNAEMIMMRIWAIRCMEYFEKPSEQATEVLLCYCRTGLKVLSASSDNTKMHQLAGICFQRGFSVVSLHQALAYFNAMDHSMDNENYAYCIVDTAVLYTSQEIEQAHGDATNRHTLAYLSSLWVEACPMLFELLDVQLLLDRVLETILQLARTLYDNGADYYAQSLAIFQILSKPGEHTSNLTCEDYLAMADVYCETGDRALGFQVLATMDKLENESREQMRHVRDLRQSIWTCESNGAETKNESHIPFQEFVFQVKRKYLCVKLYASEVSAVDTTNNIHEELDNEILSQHQFMWSAYNDLLQYVAEQLPGVETTEQQSRDQVVKDLFDLCHCATKRVSSALKHISPETIRSTYFALERFFRDMDHENQVLNCLYATIRVGLLPKFDIRIPFICELVETIDQTALEQMNPFDIRKLQYHMWKRMDLQRKEHDVLGVITTASFLVKFAINDPKLTLEAHLAICEVIVEKHLGEEVWHEKVIFHTDQVLLLVTVTDSIRSFVRAHLLLVQLHAKCDIAKATESLRLLCLHTRIPMNLLVKCMKIGHKAGILGSLFDKTHNSFKHVSDDDGSVPNKHVRIFLAVLTSHGIYPDDLISNICDVQIQTEWMPQIVASLSHVLQHLDESKGVLLWVLTLAWNIAMKLLELRELQRSTNEMWIVRFLFLCFRLLQAVKSKNAIDGNHDQVMLRSLTEKLPHTAAMVVMTCAEALVNQIEIQDLDSGENNIHPLETQTELCNTMQECLQWMQETNESSKVYIPALTILTQAITKYASDTAHAEYASKWLDTLHYDDILALGLFFLAQHELQLACQHFEYLLARKEALSIAHASVEMLWVLLFHCCPNEQRFGDMLGRFMQTNLSEYSDETKSILAKSVWNRGVDIALQSEVGNTMYALLITSAIEILSMCNPNGLAYRDGQQLKCEWDRWQCANQGIVVPRN